MEEKTSGTDTFDFLSDLRTKLYPDVSMASQIKVRKNRLNTKQNTQNGLISSECPGKDLPFFDVLAFIIDRESHCIGQIGLYRRSSG